MLYTIISDKLTSGKITVSSQIDINNKITAEKSLQLSAGYNSHAVRVYYENELKPDVIKISADVLKALSIPINLPYQLIFSEEGLKIGPVIGLLMYKKRSAMTEKSLHKHLNYMLLYKNTGGLIYIFSVGGINFDTHSIEGYYYNPLKDKWEKGVFPFPEAVYRRVFIHRKTMERLKKHIGNRIFNSNHFNKLEYWNMASSSKYVDGHIPMTRKFTSFSDIDLMFENFNALYLKPIAGLKAIGLIRIIKDNGQYSFQGKMDESPIRISSKDDAAKYFRKIKKNSIYIIQQAVDLLKIEDRYVDFRVIMQKDHTLDWQCTGIITSIGKQGGICSNYSEDAQYMHLEEFLERYLQLSKKEVFQKKNEIINIGINACKVLDKSGLYCIDLGIDIGLDQNLKTWIFELNNRNHLHLMALFINDYDMFYRVKTNPIKYIARLNGFSTE